MSVSVKRQIRKNGSSPLQEVGIDCAERVGLFFEPIKVVPRELCNFSLRLLEIKGEDFFIVRADNVHGICEKTIYS